VWGRKKGKIFFFKKINLNVSSRSGLNFFVFVTLTKRYITLVILDERKQPLFQIRISSNEVNYSIKLPYFEFFGF